MRFFIWSPEYGVEDPVIDSQHERLFELADALFQAMCQGKARDLLDQTLTDLLDYTQRHFTEEERLMERHRYPGLGQHRKAHDTLTRRVLDFQSEFRHGNAYISVELMEFLSTWLDRHIKGADRQFGAYLTSQVPA